MSVKHQMDRVEQLKLNGKRMPKSQSQGVDSLNWIASIWNKSIRIDTADFYF